MPRNSTPRTQIAIAVVEHQDRYLVGQRPPNVPLAGLWEFPGGKVQASETPAEAAARECLEETGLAVQVVGNYPTVEYDYAHDRVELHFFRCTPVDPERPPREPFRWIATADLANLEFPPANRAILEQIAATL
ncbi:MAG TPA: (deoxy)nucleoside triphosphate pyrophosphohydrolase [Pirellulales bacterium]